ncbi:thioredoxin family protein [Sphingosinicellaceae bacterium]|nr:thioredoxin family protein [Sphingosinicellaceae bacterium]
MRHLSSLIAAIAVAVAAVPAVVISAPAVAAAPAVQPYNQAAFDAAQKAGKPIIVWVHAPWCPVCREQAKTIARVTAQPAYKDMQVFRIDFDTQKPLWQKFGATMQSTVIAFHGKRETARISHDTDDAKISAVISSAIA